MAEYTRAPGKHGSKETSDTNYKKYLEKNFVAVHGQTTPKWAQLGRKPEKKSDEDSEDELTKVEILLLLQYYTVTSNAQSVVYIYRQQQIFLSKIQLVYLKTT